MHDACGVFNSVWLALGAARHLGRSEAPYNSLQNIEIIHYLSWQRQLRVRPIVVKKVKIFVGSWVETISMVAQRR
jgi:hypothetical protein